MRGVDERRETPAEGALRTPAPQFEPNFSTSDHDERTVFDVDGRLHDFCSWFVPDE